MTVKVLTYKNPYELGKLKELQPYKNCIFINATKSLNNGMRRFYSDAFTGPQVSGGLFISELMGTWSTAERKLIQYTELTELIDDMRSRMTKPEEKKIMRSFRRNQMEVLSTIRTLTEVGITPEQIPSKNLEEQIFADLWSQLEEMDSLFQETRTRLDLLNGNLFKDKNDFKDKIKDMLRPEERGYVKSNSIKTFVLHGFYFITPLQHRVFTLMKKAGFHLVFLNLYDERYQRTFHFINKFINQECGWLDEKDWKKDSTVLTDCIGMEFLSSFEKEVHESGKEKLKRKKYDDFYDFLDSFADNIRKNTHIYLTPSFNDYKNRLKDYFPECFERERHLLSYPVGQFLFHLHNMWDENSEEERLIISEQELYECFTSGWLIDKETNQNARDWAGTLHEIFPFFADCETIDDWTERIEKLKEIRENVVGVFEKETGKHTLNQRFHQMMQSPFSRFSQFNVELESINQIMNFIIRLRDIAYDLFLNQKERVSLSEHFSKIEELLFSGVEELAAENERIIINFLKRKLKIEEPSGRTFKVKDLSEAIALYLGGKFEPEENESSENKRMNPEEIIDEFNSLDGAILQKEGSNKSLHICGLDENSLPESQSVLPWPLSRDSITDLSENNISFSMIMRKEESKGEISRYLFYLFLLYKGQKECSWLLNWNGNQDIQESFYLNVLEDKLEDLDDSSNGLQFTENKLSFGDFQLSKTIEEMLKWPASALAELIYCPRRFYYSFVTRPYAVFRGDFHQQFLYGNLIKAAKAFTGEANEVVHEQVSELFPQWTNVKKRLLTEENVSYSGKYQYMNSQEPLVLEGVRYTPLQLEFQFLNLNDPKDDEEVKAKLETVKGIAIHPSLIEESRAKLKEQKDHLNMEAEPSHLCRYCPHLEICSDGYYPVDDELRNIE